MNTKESYLHRNLENILNTSFITHYILVNVIAGLKKD